MLARLGLGFLRAWASLPCWLLLAGWARAVGAFSGLGLFSLLRVWRWGRRFGGGGWFWLADCAFGAGDGVLAAGVGF